MQEAANVYSISPSSSFLSTLIDALIDGKLIKGLQRGKPHRIWVARSSMCRHAVPRMRSRKPFCLTCVHAGWQSAILPKIHVIGDAEEDLLPFKVAASGGDDFLTLPTAMDSIERRLTMTRLVHHWAQTVARQVLSLAPNQPLHVSARPTDAAYLAIDLLALIDAVHRERSDWAYLENLVPEDFGAFWQMSLDFLKIATATWPDHLKGLKLVDPVERRNAVLAAEIMAIEHYDGPVIAAGSTGSIPATADLLEAVARHPKGALISAGALIHTLMKRVGRRSAIYTQKQGKPNRPPGTRNSTSSNCWTVWRSIVRMSPCFPASIHPWQCGSGWLAKRSARLKQQSIGKPASKPSARAIARAPLRG